MQNTSLQDPRVQVGHTTWCAPKAVAPWSSVSGCFFHGPVCVCAGTQRTLRLIGPTRTKLLLFTGRRLGGAEAVDWGLADVLAEEPEKVPLVPPTTSRAS